MKWFNAEKGFGFIKRDDGQGDVFVHARQIERSGLLPLDAGEKVEFDLITSRKGEGRSEAGNIRLEA